MLLYLCSSTQWRLVGRYDLLDWEVVAQMMNASTPAAVRGQGRQLAAAAANLTTFRTFECANGSTGVLCGLCAEGFAASGIGSCVACEAEDVTAWRVIFGIAFALVFCLIAVHAMMGVDDNHANPFADADETPIDFKRLDEVIVRTAKDAATDVRVYLELVRSVIGVGCRPSDS